MPFGGDVGITTQVGKSDADLLLNVGNLLPGRIERMRCLIELRLRCDARRQKTSLAILLLFRVALRVPRRAQFNQPLSIGRLERLDLQPSICEVRRGVAYRDAEWRVVQSK